jgi:hypothetical protein
MEIEKTIDPSDNLMAKHMTVVDAPLRDHTLTSMDQILPAANKPVHQPPSERVDTSVDKAQRGVEGKNITGPNSQAENIQTRDRNVEGCWGTQDRVLNKQLSDIPTLVTSRHIPETPSTMWSEDVEKQSETSCVEETESHPKRQKTLRKGLERKPPKRASSRSGPILLGAH